MHQAYYHYWIHGVTLEAVALEGVSKGSPISTKYSVQENWIAALDVIPSLAMKSPGQETREEQSAGENLSPFVGDEGWLAYSCLGTLAKDSVDRYMCSAPSECFQAQEQMI